jgi:hypothetical protein
VGVVRLSPRFSALLYTPSAMVSVHMHVDDSHWHLFFWRVWWDCIASCMVAGGRVPLARAAMSRLCEMIDMKCIWERFLWHREFPLWRFSILGHAPHSRS